ncbi:hypothetical protein CBL_01540 [Carabus blaptoides fortunei]
MRPFVVVALLLAVAAVAHCEDAKKTEKRGIYSTGLGGHGFGGGIGLGGHGGLGGGIDHVWEQ